MTIQLVNLSDLHPHPGNPRLAPREDVVDQIVAQLDGGMDEAHALIVRPNGAGYQIVSGHHRALAAEKAGLTAVPCWVREMSDEDAYMALALNNAQGELRWYEEGKHAYDCHIFENITAYADALGKTEASDTIGRKKNAWEVWVSAASPKTTPPMEYRALREIHAVPGRWLWRALVAEMLAKEWSVDQTRASVKRVKDAAVPPEWVDHEALASDLISGMARVSDVGRFEKIAKRCEDALRKGEDDAERLIDRLWAKIKRAKPKRLSDLEAICVAIEREQRDLIDIRRQADLLRTKREEQIMARTRRLKQSVSLKEWRDELKEDERAALLTLTPQDCDVGAFNPQENDDIEWAQWSWNPVTGCLHDCPYCYARDIANQSRMAAVYPNQFEPTFRPAAVLVPRVMKVPKEAKTDARFKNVFTCSMADLFGRWVPDEWIETVLREMRAASQWHFLCLTKFPKRMAEFEIPDNTWMGTTVDLQARVPAAEAAFAKVNAQVKWLSIEPMLEPIRFSKLDLFDWIVIGGSSRQSNTPAWYPPSEWVMDLRRQADDAGVAVYEKSNLWSSSTPRTLQLPAGLPVEQDENGILPEVFRYLGKAKTENQKPER